MENDVSPGGDPEKTTSRWNSLHLERQFIITIGMEEKCTEAQTCAPQDKASLRRTGNPPDGSTAKGPLFHQRRVAMKWLFIPWFPSPHILRDHPGYSVLNP